MITSNCRRSLLICALLSAITLAAYWPVLNNGFINLDDYVYVTQNPNVESGLTWENVKWSFQGGYAANWHPLTWMSHMLDVQLFGLNPRWHHLVNLLLHLANTLLLFLLVQNLTRLAWRSALVAALFAVHPLHVESVAWAAERKDVLSTFFFMLTLLAYARYAQKQSRVEPSSLRFAAPGSRGSMAGSGRLALDYWLALIFFALGLMSKPMLVTVPFVLLLLDVWPLGRAGFKDTNAFVKSLTPLVREKTPFFLLSAAACCVTFWAQDKGSGIIAFENLPLDYRVPNAIFSYWKYLGKTVWPAKLAVFYPYSKESGPGDDWQIALAGLLLVAVSLFAVSRIKRWPWLAIGWFWFLGTLVPVIGLIQAGVQSMADRYTYVPLIGVFLGLVWTGAEIPAARRLGGKFLAAVGALVVLACAVATRQQVGYWRNNFTIASHALAVTVKNPVAEDLLGQVLVEEGRYEPAAEHFRAALAIAPGYGSARYDLAVALTRSAIALAEAGKLEEAAKTYQSALEIEPLPSTLNGLGLVLELLGRPEEAIPQFTGALRLQPDNVEYHLNLALAFAGQGKMAEAEAHYAEALRLGPDQLRALMDFGRFQAGQGQLAEAGAKFREAVRLYPTNAEASLQLGANLMLSGQTNEAARLFSAALRLEPGLAEKNLRDGKRLANNGQVDAALRCWIIACWLKPDDVEARENLGMLFLRRGRPDEALMQFEELLRLRPDAQSHYDLGLALNMQGKAGAAASHYETAIKLKPDWPEALNDLAWLLATTPDAQLRNGARAVELGEQACRLTDFKQPLLVGTLAAAYAETGRFVDAAQTAEKAIALASAQNNQELAQRNRELLEFYRAGKTVLQSQSSAGK